MSLSFTSDVEAREGFAPSHNGFADRRVASSPPGHSLKTCDFPTEGISSLEILDKYIAFL